MQKGNISVTGTVDGIDIAGLQAAKNSISTSNGAILNGVTATTQSAGDSSTKIATTAYADTAVSNLVDSAPSTLNTLNELAAALGDDANFSTTVTNSIATKLANIVEDISPQLGGDLDCNNKVISMNDSSSSSNNRLKLGNAGDLQVYHDGSNSFVSEAGTGNLFVASNGGSVILYNTSNSETLAKFTGNGSNELYNNGNKKFETYASGARIPNDGGIFAIGASNDLQLIHDGTDSSLKNLTGETRIQCANIFKVTNYQNTETYIKGSLNGAVELYYDNDLHLSTSATGVFTNGSFSFRTDSNTEEILYDQANGKIRFNDSKKANFGSDDDMTIKHDGSNAEIVNTTGSLLIDGQNTLTLRSAGNIIGQVAESETAFQAIANGSVELYYNNSKKLDTSNVGINVSGNLSVNDGVMTITHSVPGINFEDNSGSNGNDFAIQVNGNSFKIVDTDNSSRTGFNFGSDGNTSLGGNTTFGGIGFFSHSGDEKIRLSGSNNPYIQFREGNTNKAYIQWSTNGSLYLANSESGEQIRLGSGTDGLMFIEGGNTRTVYHTGNLSPMPLSGGNFTGDIGARNITPTSNNSFDLGSSSLRWRNLYVNDMHFSNSVENPNKVDGTWGDWTLQEGEDQIYMLNNRNGKKYKMNLTEIV